MHTAGLKVQNYRKSRDVQPRLSAFIRYSCNLTDGFKVRALINELENLETLA
jgi:hypothetical protein